MAFKILAALLIACIAQNVASGASLPRDKPSQEINEFNAMMSTYGNPLACVPHLYSLWNVVQDGRTYFSDFLQIRKRYAELKDTCSKLPQEEEKKECLKKADDNTQKDTDILIEKLRDYLPKVIDVAQKFKQCLLD